MTNNTLSNIAFEDITEDYCFGNYGEFKVIMMKKNGYINATKMCQDISEQTGSKKPYYNWKENKTVGDLINEISYEQGIPGASLTIVIGTSDPKIAIIRGTYVHTDLIPHIASWAVISYRLSDTICRFIYFFEINKIFASQKRFSYRAAITKTLS